MLQTQKILISFFHVYEIVNCDKHNIIFTKYLFILYRYLNLLQE